MNEELRARVRTSSIPSPEKNADLSQLRDQVPQCIVAPVAIPPSFSAAVEEPQEDLRTLANK
jgi:hypothetical protein